MTEWVVLEGDPIVGDVIAFEENVFTRPAARGRGKLKKIGRRYLVVQIKEYPDRKKMVKVVVWDCEVREEAQWKKVPMLAKESETKRHLRTFVRCKAKRMLWSDESARAVIASQFIGNSKEQKRLRNDDSEEA